MGATPEAQAIVPMPDAGVARGATAPDIARAFASPGVQAFAVGAVVLVVAILCVTTWPVGGFVDDGIYLILGKALATGQGYRYLHLPGAPAATHFPPAYPGLLALLWKIWPEFPRNIVLFKFANSFLLAGAGAGAFLFARRRLGFSALGAAATTIAFTAAIPTLALTTILLSEPLFLAILFPALLAGEQAADDGRPVGAALSGLLIAALMLTRSIGIAALASTVAVMLLRRRWRAAAIVVLVAAIALAPWQLWVRAHGADLPAALQGEYGSYHGWLAGAWLAKGGQFLFATVALNLRAYVRMFDALVAPLGKIWLAVPMLTLLVALFVMGGVRMVRRAPITLGFIVCYVGIVTVWPFTPDRFLWGIWPLIGLLVVEGAAAVVAWRPASRRSLVARRAMLTGVAAATLAYAAYDFRGFPLGWWQTVQRTSSQRMIPTVNWVARHTAPNDLIACGAEAMVYLYSGRQAIPTGSFTPGEYIDRPTPPHNLADARALLALYPVRYFVATTEPAFAAADLMLRARPPELQLVDTLPGGGAVFIPIPR